MLGHGAILSLAHTLLAIFATILVGCIAVHLQYISEAGETKALAFFTAKIAFPLLIFKTVATSELVAVDLDVILACALGKATVLAVTWTLVFVSFEAWRPLGQRVLSATVFGFFTVASNDFAIGLPVMNALYGNANADMDMYIAANALVGAVVFMPLAVFLFALGQFLQDDRRSSRGSSVSQCAEVCQELVKSPVIICTAAGLVYKALPASCVRQGALPPPISNVVDLFANLFSASALLLTGTSIRLESVGTWPITLAIMKVLVCAYVSDLFGKALVTADGTSPGKYEVLANFPFFYGSLPSSSAPLVFASQFAPGATHVVATAVLMGLILAGPVMFTTALFLREDKSMASMTPVLRDIQLTCVLVSLAFGAFFLCLLTFLRQSWFSRGDSKTIIAAHGLALCLYELLMLVNNPSVNPSYCKAYNHYSGAPLAVVICWIQNAIRFMVISLQYRCVRGACRAEAQVVAVCMALGCVPAFAVMPNTLNEICGSVGPQEYDASLWPNLVWNSALLLAMVALALLGMCIGPAADLLPADKLRISPGHFPPADLPSPGSSTVGNKPPTLVMRVLFITQALRFLMQVVNTSLVAWQTQGVLKGSRSEVRGSFSEMLSLENVLEHSQLVCLVLALLGDDTFTRDLRQLLHRRSEGRPAVVVPDALRTLSGSLQPLVAELSPDEDSLFDDPTSGSFGPL